MPAKSADTPPMEPQYATGWMTDQHMKGVKPDYSLPQTGLPPTDPGASTEMVTGFIAALEAETGHT